ncbi:hypothetical protein L3Y34_005426 [Caenorhabditis briggsae]|uniref:C-type lectin domain-containing protein n=1 Tax=Caenorhabditis briggsae TaxID=6238 RepID=A0AAE9AG46_CAEBR|nr:hypothetical protein L3Y34_005426 [Caenorhabditis briggsae]
MHVYILFWIFGPKFFGFVSSQCLEDDDAYIGGLCYTVSTYKESFPVAQNACHRKNQNLAIIKNSLQANYLATTVQKITNEQNGKFWIGLNRSSINSRYQWDDGTPLVWSNFDSKFSQNQLWVAESTQNGKWTTLDGGEAHFFVCSHDPSASTPQPSPTPDDGSTTYGPWETTPYPDDGSTTYGPWETTPYPDDGSTTYGPWETTPYPDDGSTTYGPWETTPYPDDGSTTYGPWETTPYPDDGSTTYGPWETTPYPDDGSTTYGPWETTPYPDDGSTTYGPWETTSYDDYGTTDYPDYGSTDYPDYGSTDYSDYDPTTDFSQIRINKLPKPLRRFFQKKR